MLYVFIIIIIILFLFLRGYGTTSTVFVFWTGGFDSTFIIMNQLLSDKFTIIQPIYIEGCLDNVTCDGGRQNRFYERRSMNAIRHEIEMEFPGRLLPTIYISDIHLSPDVIHHGVLAYQTKTMMTRAVNQYTSMAQVCRDKGIHQALVGIVKDDERWSPIVLQKTGTQRCSIDYSIPFNQANYQLFKHFRFPCIHLTKRTMYSLAREQGFAHILEMTFSCWFPHENGTPCGTCEMCRHRSI